jgi:hypothetical protein
MLQKQLRTIQLRWTGIDIDQSMCGGVSQEQAPAENQLSYKAALRLWTIRRDSVEASKASPGSRPKVAKDQQLVVKYQRLLGIARAKSWAATEYGRAHNQQSDREDLESPLPDHTGCHLSASQRDITLHIHKAIFSIGLEWDISVSITDHPVVQREYILLLLRFKGSTLPTKTEFALLVHTYLISLARTVQEIDQSLIDIGK